MADCEGAEGEFCKCHIESHRRVYLIEELDISMMNSYQNRRTIGGSETAPGPV